MAYNEKFSTLALLESELERDKKPEFSDFLPLRFHDFII